MRMNFPLISCCKLWLLFLLLSVSSSFQTGNVKDMQSLLAFKAQITHDPLGVLTSWNHSLHFCQWWGVTCSRRHGRVVELDLHSCKLQGSLSPHVGNLSFLRALYLDDNSLDHHIPQELGRLFWLHNLQLENNTFDGVIPVNISRCSNLLFLGLRGNELTGKLPVELGTLSKLEVLTFSRNNLVGEIPPSLGNLTSITKLYGSHNNLQGGIPNSLGQLKRLSIFAFSANNLTGTIPSSLYNLSALTVYDVGVNNFHGSLPPDLFRTLPYLEGFHIGVNQFIGEIPVSLSNASHLSDFNGPLNNLIGKVPTLEGLHNLRRLGIGGNDLGGGEEGDDLSFLYSLANNTNLELVDIAGNNFGGMLPDIVTNFSTNLSYMAFWDNHMHGRIPMEIGNLISLEILTFGMNQFTGTIPTSIGKLQKLNTLTLHGNNITGSIPSSLGNITSLIKLDASQNKLQGRIPPSLGNCQNLLQLNLSGNELSGLIPEEVISISSLSLHLDMSRNQLSGSIPTAVGRLVNLGVLNMSDNRLSGEIPRSLAGCVSLEMLNLGGNSFQGMIPESLSSLRAIQYLNFSHNNLTGKISKFFTEFRLLVDLDLSFNDLEGAVPVEGVFADATNISVVGNKNLCGGIPQLKLSKCLLNKAKTSVKLLSAIACGCLGIILTICFLLFYCMRKGKMFPSQSYQKKSYLEKSLQRVTYEDLCQATSGFSSCNLIGVGSFGSVYKGILHSDRKIVAVKVVNLLHKGALKSFMAECKTLINIRHRNLVKIITVCSSIDFQGNDFKALVYEFMVNGNLDEWLHPEETYEPRNLNLMQRLDIAIDIVSALNYLHHHCQTPIIHCDLKPSNVLLDGDMIAHVGDFGLARFLQEVSDQLPLNHSSSIGIKGTIGYAAPEYGMGSEVSTYGDIYSFGILLLEMFTGKRPTDYMFKDGLNLHNFVKSALPDALLNVVDPALLHEQKQMSLAASRIRNPSAAKKFQECMIMVLKVGVACSEEFPRDRMDISSAEIELHRIRDILLGTRMPFR